MQFPLWYLALFRSDEGFVYSKKLGTVQPNLVYKFQFVFSFGSLLILTGDGGGGVLVVWPVVLRGEVSDGAAGELDVSN